MSEGERWGELEPGGRATDDAGAPAAPREPRGAGSASARGPSGSSELADLRPPSRGELSLDPLAPPLRFELEEILPAPRPAPLEAPRVEASALDARPLAGSTPNDVATDPAPPPPKGKQYACERCDAVVPTERALVSKTSHALVAVPTCPDCGGRLTLEDAPPSQPLALALLATIRWPFAGPNLASLAAQALVFWLIGGVGSTFFGFASLLLRLAALGLLLGHAASILRASAEGDDTVPLPADAITSPSMLLPALRHGLVFLVGAVPLSLVTFSPGLFGVGRLLIFAFALLFFCLYVPAGQIVVATNQSFAAALNPIPPIRFALYAGKEYLVVCAVLFGFALLYGLVLVLVALIASLAFILLGPLLQGLLTSAATTFVFVWGVFVVARMLGVFVHERRGAVILT